MAKGLVSIINIPGNLVKFAKEARDELKKVSWPTRDQTTRYTIIVVVVSLLVGGLIGGIDYALRIILEQTVL